MPACHNCGNVESFVLLVEFAVPCGSSAPRARPGPSLSLSCARCDSADVAGDPAAVLAARRHDSG